MFRNYLKVALRNMVRFKVLAVVNILGLALGIACAILIIFYIKDEITFDSFHSKAERIYRPWTKAQMRGRESINSATPFNMGKQLYENFEEVEKYTVWTSFSDIVENEQNSFTEIINIASPQFFEIFDFEVLHGATQGILSEPGDLVITQDIAEKYFGNTAVTGKLLKIQVGGQMREFEIKTVVGNVPSNSSLQFAMIISDLHLKEIFPEQMLTSWFMITGENYLLLSEGTDPEVLSKNFQSLISQNLGERASEMDYNIFLQPVKDIHLNTEIPAGNAPAGNPRYIYILSAIAILILVIAGINFMILALGRSLSRTREIGVRKSVGANRAQLIFQFLGEALIAAIIALIVGIGLAYMSLGWFNSLSGKSLSFDLSIQNIGIFVLLAMATGLIAGIYPALIMSAMKSADIIKGNLPKGGNKQKFRSVLIGIQFVLSIFLIASTLIMKNQLTFLQNKDLGFDKESVIVVPLNISDARGLRDIVQKGFDKSRIIIPELVSSNEIADVAVSSHTFEPGNWTQVGWMDEEDQQYSFFYNTVDARYIPALGMELVMGRNFSDENQADSRRSIIVNEAFVDAFNLEQPIGARIPGEAFDDHEIIGVVKDFHIESLHTAIQPLVLAMNVNIGFSGAQSVNVGSSEVPKLFIRSKAGRAGEAIKAVNQVWERVYPEDPFDYTFIDENLKQQYEREKNLENIVTSASLIAVIVGCLGLFGLSTLTLVSKIKEVSIRKIFGASRKSLALNLSKGFAIMILIALIVASPISWYFMDNWLQQFEYRIDITPIIFLLSGVFTLFVAIITISYQMLKVLKTNPATSLRME